MMTLERAARFCFIVFLMLGASALVAGCGSDEPAKPAVKSTAKATQPRPSKANAKVSEPTVAEQLAMRVDLPDYYPEDAPLYPGAKTSSVGWQRGRVNAVFTTDDDPSDVSRKVQSNLRSKGWDEIVEAEMSNGVVVQAGKDERGVSALISRMQEGSREEVTMILVTIDP